MCGSQCVPENYNVFRRTPREFRLEEILKRGPLRCSTSHCPSLSGITSEGDVGPLFPGHLPPPPQKNVSGGGVCENESDDAFSSNLPCRNLVTSWSLSHGLYILVYCASGISPLTGSSREGPVNWTWVVVHMHEARPHTTSRTVGMREVV